eukprot:CAMPEP_0179056292 /NCGR_PEP_ID=MMETSP0796-20121207/23737_1 /TAXON_ID=73915 /ORGANISM="Pyrodinium bahamense, Strain pbaha01" /LENGTH=884 /DNA_ID=CAMNT_0020752963 /DNA_START=100 /DNA_END=2754 /DNA_ORIENTATION=+
MAPTTATVVAGSAGECCSVDMTAPPVLGVPGAAKGARVQAGPGVAPTGPQTACLLALLERWLQSSSGAAGCDEAGFVLLSDALQACAGLRSLAGDSLHTLAEAVRASPPDGPVELNPQRGAVRLRGRLERVRTAVERHAKAAGPVDLLSLLRAAPVVAALEGLPEVAERLQVLRQAVESSQAVPVICSWDMQLATGAGDMSTNRSPETLADVCQPAPVKVEGRGAQGFPSKHLSADAPVFLPSWLQVGSAKIDGSTCHVQRRPVQCPNTRDAGKKRSSELMNNVPTEDDTVKAPLHPDGDIGNLAGSFEREPDSEPEAEASPQEDKKQRVSGTCSKSAMPCPVIEQKVLGESNDEDNPVVSCASSNQVALGRGSGQKNARTARTTEACAELEVPELKVPASKQVSVSPNSWVAQQRMRRCSGVASAAKSSDDEIARTIKSLLNKLTVERFYPLSQKLISCEIRKPAHLELLIQEVFDKATTQHHFIDMYADLCVLLHEHFTQNSVDGDPKFSFRRLLLNQCQASFERNLAPPGGLDDLEREERIIEETRYKTRMVGNIRFIGALLTRRLLGTKVMVAILQELLGDPTPEALEAVAVLLTAVGPTFDVPECGLHSAFNSFFARVKDLISRSSCEPRARCLLKDVVELRQAGWHSHRPQRQELPTTLEVVADRAAAEGAGINTPKCRFRAQPLVAAAARRPIAMAAAVAGHASTKRPQEAEPIQAPVGTPQPTQVVDEPQLPAFSSNEAHIDHAEYHGEVSKTLAELRVSHDATEAVARLVAMGVPSVRQQAEELTYVLAQVVQAGNADTRRAGFKMAVDLFAHGHWHQRALQEGLRCFFGEVCEDLQVDVPGLVSILEHELTPALDTLVQQRMVTPAASSPVCLK